eukprot:gene14599-16755_t
MSIYINKDTKVITQGITGKTGQFHTEKCQEYANGKNCFVAGVNPKKAGESIFNIPIYASVKEAATQTGATVSVIYVPPAGAAAAIWEAVEADLDMAICITEGIPVRDMLEVRNKMKAKEAAGGKRTLLLGPNCPGLITPDEIKIGIMPGHIHRKGRIGVVSRSGTLTYEAVAMLTEVGLGQSSAVGIGGDPINGLKHIDVMKAFNDDPDTDAVIMIGEIGGPDEAEAAMWCKANMKKPVVGFIAGVTAPPGKRMGHAGALISGGADTADAKLAIMEECGFIVTRNPSELGKLLKAQLKNTVEEFLTPHFWFAVGQIIMIDILLGGDNAVVIALACRQLPAQQRTQGILWGTAGAIILRVILIFFALTLLAIPFLKFVGAVLLIWIGVKLLTPDEEDDHGNIQGSDKLWGAVKTVIIADLVMSIDNVIAIAGAAQTSGNADHQMPLVIFGLLVSIPIIVWGSQLVLKLMDRFPLIITIGGMLLGWIAGTMVQTDPALVAYIPQDKMFGYGLGVAGALLVLGLGKFILSRRKAASDAAA